MTGEKEPEAVDKTIAEDLVVTKYKMAGDLVNRKFCLLVVIILMSCVLKIVDVDDLK